MTRPDPQLKNILLAHLKANHSEIWRHWFDDIEPLEIAKGTLRILVQEPIQLKYLQRCCGKPFSEAAQSATGRLLGVRFVGDAELLHESVGADQSAENGMNFCSDQDMLLCPDFSFANFVVGPSNELAHAAAVAVSHKPGRAYNPFFIHSAVGLGKTHLLQAICQSMVRSGTDLKIYYTSCENFNTQFLNAVQAGQMADFRHRFRNMDVLFIDDIHDLAKRERTQEEFFHTFNCLFQSGKQLVLSSDASPNEIPALEERLTSRFNSGLVAKIERPDLDTRVAIIQKKAKMRNLVVPNDVAAYIAGRINSNIRELEGALAALQVRSAASGQPICLELAKDAVGQDETSLAAHQLTIQGILNAVSVYYDVKISDLLSRRRQQSIALPRQVAMWLARSHTRFSLQEIGGYIGGRDHTTVMHAVRSINRRRDGDPMLAQDVTRLENDLSCIVD